MDDLLRTKPIANPIANMTIHDYLAGTAPRQRLSARGIDGEIIVREDEQRGYELARRLGVESKSGRLPAYVCAIVFRHGDEVDPSAHNDHTVIGMHIPQNIARDFLDEVGIWLIAGQQRHIVAQTGAHSLETTDLEFEEIRPLDQRRTRLETMPSVDCVMGEVGRRAQARKQHKNLSDPRSPIIHGMNATLRAVRGDAGTIKPGTSVF